MFTLDCHGSQKQLWAMCIYGMIFIAVIATSDGTTGPTPLKDMHHQRINPHTQAGAPTIDFPSKRIKLSFLMSNYGLEWGRESGREKEKESLCALTISYLSINLGLPLL